MFTEGKPEELLKTLNASHRDGDVVEVRILKTKKNGTVSGYFDDFEVLVKSIEEYVGHYDIYSTLNPVKKALLARCQNRLEKHAKKTTSDGDVEHLRYILVDVDPLRPSGISSTKEEKDHAGIILKTIRKDLIKQGFPEPLVGDSGNGYHLMIPVDLENTPENVALQKDFLAALDFLYSNEHAQIDRTTYNPSRIVKFYGTKACKGDDIPDRPHRWSRLVKVPEIQHMATRELLESIVSQLPKLDDAANNKTKNKSKNNDFDIEAWLAKHRLQVAYKALYQSKATKYILEVCPWNSDHADRSAYIVHFDNGAIAAGCHHNGCKDENWQSLWKLFESEAQAEESAEEKQSDILLRLAQNFQYFKNDIEEMFAAVEINSHCEVMPIKSRKFSLYMTKLYFEETGKAQGIDALNQVLKVLEMKAMFSDQERKLQRRIAFDENDGTYYYDLRDKDWNVVKINETGVEIPKTSPILFTRNDAMKEQVKPDLSTAAKVLVELVQKHFRFKKEEDCLLFTVYLVCSFLPQIAHVILVLFGEKGAAKSTTMRMTKQIVDPGRQDLLAMPTSKQDLAIILSNTYMPSFDNLDALSREKSDMLCMAATGGAFSKRTLFTDADETVLRFKRCVALNGINVVATRPDLLDRSIVLELERIPKTERKTEAEVWRSFEADMPKFLGAIFNTLSKAIPLREEITLEEVGRMADFTYWGYAVAEVLELGGDNFLKAYLGNQDRANEEALDSHPVAAAVQTFLKTTSKWSGSVSALLKELESTAETERINTRVRTWPKDSFVLSKRLKEVKSNLEEIGIYYDIRNTGNFKKITLEKVSDKANHKELMVRPPTEILSKRPMKTVNVTSNGNLAKLFEPE